MNHVRNHETMQVVRVERLEPLPLRLTWMNELSHGVAFLESLGLAHGDLRPENILLDRNRLKISDFDCTANIGSEYEACIAPWGRILGEGEGMKRGTAGFLGPRTEQFALGSIYYLINYGLEVYDDKVFGDDPSGKEHGPVVLDMLQNKVFPELNSEPMIDDIIMKCWSGRYETIAQLSADTEKLCPDTDGTDPEIEGLGNGQADEFSSQQKFCVDLVERGLLQSLPLGNPRDHGFTIERRYVCWKLLHS